MAEGIAFIDGEYVPASEAKISIFDVGFTRGDAVYDTVSVWKGLFFRLDDHVGRFFRSCAGMRLTCPHAPAELKQILAGCVHRAGLESAYVQMIVTRGRFLDLAERDPRRCQNKFIGFALPYIWIFSPRRQEAGVHVVIAGTRRTPAEAIDPRVKNFNWMDLERGLLEALDRGADTAVLCTPAGYLTEGPGFNLFVVKDRELLTPRRNVLEGITRRTVFDLAAELGVPGREVDLTPESLREADEALLSSTAGGIMPVSRVDGRPLGTGTPGPLSSRLRALYWEKREAGWLGTPVKDLLAT
ncbi:MAG TPA: aminotransferase class IV [Methylomirabilota bacterium]|jgi:branched-chain amino acid aminotransferase|nr:aminotransferase class IV [Methylomirabilota bacterium]